MAFASSFFIIGQNQIDFDDLNAKESKDLAYKTFARSVWYVYSNYVLLGKKFADFSMGDESQRMLLYAFFIVATLYIFVILMNMLIAIM